jgi:F420-dependent oxidoreductase-like protein
VIEDLHGLAFTSPAAHLRDYLAVLVPLLREGTVHHRGEFYSVNGGVTVPGTRPVSVLVAALSPKMPRAAGELAEGVVTWLAGPRSLGEHIVPALHAAAAGRVEPRILAGLPVAVCDDAGAARDTADEVFVRYAGMVNYRRLLEREGVGSPGQLAVTGTEAEVEKRLRRLADLGVTELWPVLFGAEADRRRTRALLTGLTARS